MNTIRESLIRTTTVNESNKITYKANGNVTKVYLGTKHVGDIKKSSDGYYYKVKGSNNQGDIFKSIDAVKNSLEESKSIEVPSKGKNGYVGFYKRKRYEVYADSLLDARNAIAKFAKARKPYEVNVTLATKEGKQVVHKPLF